MKLYGLKNCDSCKKALKALESAGHTVDFINIREDACIDRNLVEKWLLKAGQKKLLNTRSTSWRNLSENEKNIQTQDQTLSLLMNNRTLIKRPVIEVDEEIFIGWSKEEQQALL